MRTKITINGSSDPKVNYLCWSPVKSQVFFDNLTGVIGPVTVTLRNQNPASNGGQVVFYSAVASPAQDQLQLVLPADGTPVEFFMGGKFLRPSLADKDAVIEVVNTTTGVVLSTLSLMVRIRKNANNLTRPERDRFISALAKLNNAGAGAFRNFRDMHISASSPEAHFNAGFLPWHRAYLLDLERELQEIDPSVTLPYWRFDQSAPNIFTRDFLGAHVPPSNLAQWSSTNPLRFWTTDGIQDVRRLPLFNTASSPAQGSNESVTLNLGLPGNMYRNFRAMEGNPHGSAHVSFNGYLNSIPTAAKDPLFFLLHANVDRLWAKWQWLKQRFDSTLVATFEPTTPPRVGHDLGDTMWPWNQITTAPRPTTAPGGNFPGSLITDKPGQTPTVRSMIDYQGAKNLSNRLGFDYDDVPFQFI